MGAPIPALGWRSRTDAAVALQAQGLNTAAIAEVLGIRSNEASNLLASARRQGLKTPRRAVEDQDEALGRTIRLDQDLRDRLRYPAAKRNMTVPALALLIIEVVVDEKLIDAVLDDREGV